MSLSASYSLLLYKSNFSPVYLSSRRYHKGISNSQHKYFTFSTSENFSVAVYVRTNVCVCVYKRVCEPPSIGCYTFFWCLTSPPPPYPGRTVETARSIAPKLSNNVKLVSNFYVTYRYTVCVFRASLVRTRIASLSAFERSQSYCSLLLGNLFRELFDHDQAGRRYTIIKSRKDTFVNKAAKLCRFLKNIPVILVEESLTLEQNPGHKNGEFLYLSINMN